MHMAAMGAAGLLAIVLAAVALLAIFDWNRTKPWINTRLSEATGRPFAIEGELSLTWHAPQGETGWHAWVPWPRLTADRVRIGNPSWAQEPAMAEVRQVTFSIRPLSLLRKRVVIPSLALDAPQLLLLRLEDGRNNWTFAPRKAQNEWRFDVQRLVLSKGSLQLEDAVTRSKLRADITTLPEDSAPYRIGWRLDGTYRDEAVTGNGRAGRVLSLREEDAKFPIEADLRFGKTSVVAKGTISHPSRQAQVDLQLKLAGVTMAHLYPLIHVVLPETRPFVTEGRLTGKPGQAGADWSYEDFTGKVGASDLSGTIRFRARKGQRRGLLEGSVVSSYLNFNDLSPLVGSDSDASRKARGVKTPQPEDKVLPVEKFRPERWTSIDADVQFSGRKIVRKETLPINNLITHIRLDDGVLSLAPLKFGMAGGSFVSSIRLDGNVNPVKGELKMSARHVKLKQLFPSLEPGSGEINADAALAARGDSVAALAAAANGEFKAVMNQGSLSKLKLESMGMNVGSVIATQLFGDKQIAIHCAATDFVIEKGVMQARAFVVDTEDAILNLKGEINLAQEKIAMTLYPDSKGVRLISLRTPLYVNGSFKKIQVVADKGVMAVKAGSAIALGVLAPVAAALVPLVNVGPGESSECGKLLAQASAKPVAPAASEGNR